MKEENDLIYTAVIKKTSHHSQYNKAYKKSHTILILEKRAFGMKHISSLSHLELTAPEFSAFFMRILSLAGPLLSAVDACSCRMGPIAQ